uniref:Uncharacterized protein n=1 Tax=Caenorhabditis japonica TaxID=281687 RepID=A0A8R1EGI3_CAEJA
MLWIVYTAQILFVILNACCIVFDGCLLYACVKKRFFNNKKKTSSPIVYISFMAVCGSFGKLPAFGATCGWPLADLIDPNGGYES